MKKNPVIKYLLFIGAFLLSFIFFIIMIDSIIFLFHGSLFKYTPILSLLLSIFLILLFAKKEKILNKVSVLWIIIVPLLIIIFSIYISGKVFDYSFDGNDYHKVTIDLLDKGWNPIYESIDSFIKDNDYQIVIPNTYGEYYGKSAHFYSSSIYHLTGNIESGKSINIISLIILFCFVLAFLLYKKKFNIWAIFMAIEMITLPIMCSQLFTNYIDLLVYVFFFLTILMFISIKESFIENKLLKYLLYIMILSISTNLKLNLLGYIAIVSIIYYLLELINYLKNRIDKKNFKYFTMSSLIAVIITFFLFGLSSYTKNIYLNGSIFYPVIENDNYIIQKEEPEEFKDKKNYQKFWLSTFAKTADHFNGVSNKVELKIPFTLSTNEVFALYLYDIRVSGNGVLFSGILIISIFIILWYAWKHYSHDDLIIYLLTLCSLLLPFFINGTWWARFYPVIHLIPILSIYLLYLDSNKKILLIWLIAIIFINNSLSLMRSIYVVEKKNSIIYKDIMEMKIKMTRNNCKISFKKKSLPGSVITITNYLGIDPKYNNYEAKGNTINNLLIEYNCEEDLN